MDRRNHAALVGLVLTLTWFGLQLRGVYVSGMTSPRDVATLTPDPVRGKPQVGEAASGPARILFESPQSYADDWRPAIWIEVPETADAADAYRVEISPPVAHSTSASTNRIQLKPESPLEPGDFVISVYSRWTGERVAQRTLTMPAVVTLVAPRGAPGPEESARLLFATDVEAGSVEASLRGVPGSTLVWLGPRELAINAVLEIGHTYTLTFLAPVFSPGGMRLPMPSELRFEAPDLVVPGTTTLAGPFQPLTLFTTRPVGDASILGSSAVVVDDRVVRGRIEVDGGRLVRFSPLDEGFPEAASIVWRFDAGLLDLAGRPLLTGSAQFNFRSGRFPATAQMASMAQAVVPGGRLEVVRLTHGPIRLRLFAIGDDELAPWWSALHDGRRRRHRGLNVDSLPTELTLRGRAPVWSAEVAGEPSSTGTDGNWADAYPGAGVARATVSEGIQVPDDLAPGAYEAELGPYSSSYALVTVGHLAAVLKSDPTHTTVWVTDPVGEPVANADVRLLGPETVDVSQESHAESHTVRRAGATDAQGLYVTALARSAVRAVVARSSRGVAVAWLPMEEPWYLEQRERRALEPTALFFLITDRLFYQGGDTVRFRIEARGDRDGALEPLAERVIQPYVWHKSAGRLELPPLSLDESGAGEGSVVLPASLASGSLNFYAAQGSNSFFMGRAIASAPGNVVVEVEAPATANHGEAMSVRVRVTTPSGQPLEGARVTLDRFRSVGSGSGTAFGGFGEDWSRWHEDGREVLTESDGTALFAVVALHPTARSSSDSSVGTATEPALVLYRATVDAGVEAHAELSGGGAAAVTVLGPVDSVDAAAPADSGLGVAASVVPDTGSIRVVVRSSIAGPALLGLERGRLLKAVPISLVAGTTTYDVAREDGFEPNLAVTVARWYVDSDGRHRTERASVGLAVPADSRQVRVDLQPDPNGMGSGDEASLTLRTTNQAGEPVRATVTLRVVPVDEAAIAGSLTGGLFARSMVSREVHVVTGLWDTWDDGAFGYGCGGHDDWSVELRRVGGLAVPWVTVDTGSEGQITVSLSRPGLPGRYLVLAHAASGVAAFGDAVLPWQVEGP